MKVLIYLEEDKIAPVGGPLGVGYHMYQTIRDNSIDYIEFLPGNSKQKEREAKQKAWLYKSKLLTKIVRSVRHIIEYRNMFDNPVDNSNLFAKYDIVHFHRTSDMYKQRKSLAHFKGKVIITSHSPIPLAQELYAAAVTNIERRFMKKKWEKFEEMDAWSFLNADYIVFPCEDAEEPYYLNWKYYKTIHEKKKNNYRYIPTGISNISPSKDRTAIRKQYNIPQEQFLVVYAGRHNEVKGYDSLKSIGSCFLNQEENSSFLIAGTEGPLKRLEHERWIEAGWTREVHAIINAGDVFILPNKYTYFDLIMLEVLALGKIVIASRTGGNKYFEKAKVKGVFLYDTEDQAIELLHQIKNLSKEKKIELEKSNREYFEEHLTAEKYVNTYVEMIQTIMVGT